ncbi:hypothetical protein A3D88_03885 [Candidatus Peribacteria bacterium RIFCSPHIGHO2_02_FULL_52_16]|nr:MAG: hypothetical protein A2706_04700 [Candidatus Peribacteria bacterium RIFCSPHIGHO2_01_FULL_51_35]OGJ61821.1 MAG: hypothetical protein A3D88_03885 [Candidatus Peribacteria bacterium RIFCSPHIGHO2_02_FULL_52_16]
MKRFSSFQSPEQESRLLHYEWNSQRLWEEGKTYVDLPPEQNNVIDATRRAAAGAVHFVTGVFESIAGDAVRAIQGRENRVDLAPYSGSMPRTKLDVKESLNAVGNVFRGKLSSILTLPIIAFKAIGDVGADVADELGGVRRPKAA